MRALVTGSAGFIGSHVAAALKDAGYSVLGADIVSGMDVRRFGQGLMQQRAGWFDVVVHCAAVVGGRKVMDWTPLKHAANLEIDAALFQWAATAKPGRVVYFSSSCAYPARLGRGEHEWRMPDLANLTQISFGGDVVPIYGTNCPECHGSDLPDPKQHREGCTWVKQRMTVPAHRMREDDIALHDPARWPDQLYGWAKLTGELLAETTRAAGVPVSVVRPFSVYGPGMKDGFAVTGFTEQIRHRADPVMVWGDDRQTRDYIHVADVAAAVLAMIRDGIDGPVNLGTGRAVSLRELAGLLARAAGYEPGIKVDESLPAGLPYLVADSACLRRFYEPKITLEDYAALAFAETT